METKLVKKYGLGVLLLKCLEIFVFVEYK